MARGINIGGVLPVKLGNDDVERTAQKVVELPLFQGLAGYVREKWQEAREHKRKSGVERRLQEALLARQGRYSPEDEAELRKQGAPLIYMMLTATKCRTAAGWLRDVFLSRGADKPWTIRPTSEPTLPESAMPTLVQEAMQEAVDIENAYGAPVDRQLMEKIVERARDRLAAAQRRAAVERVRRMERRMEDQLEEGDFYSALDQFIEDLVTYPAAFMKGPVVRRRRVLQWRDGRLQPVETLRLEWERVSPFDIYPSPWSSTVDDGYLIERRRMSPVQLEGLVGVAGFAEAPLRAALRAFEDGSLESWTDSGGGEQVQAEAEDKDVEAQRSSTIDVLQFWGPVQGRLLREWGMSEKDIPDPDRYYEVEVWLIGRWVVRAILNPDPLGRRPYYKASYEDVPGSFWGHGVPELMRDCQQVCNAAARSMVMNMALASGPQVEIDTTMLPDGEDPTQIYPWKVWLVKSNPIAGGTGSAVRFFQPSSNAPALMSVYEKFSQLADEYTGLPRYMAGDTRVGGAGRTASGLSMLMGNANRGLKQVVASIDAHVIQPLLERLYTYNVQIMNDPAMIGDVRIIAHGARMLMIKETTQLRRNEFLQLVMQSPVLLNLVGEEGLAALLREQARGLDMDVDKLVPPEAVLRARAMQQALVQQMAASGKQPQGVNVGSGQQLVNGAPVNADMFQPPEGA